MATRIELEQNSTRNQLILEPFPDGIYGKVTPEQLLIYNPPVFSPTVLKICVGSKSKNKDGIAIGEPALTEALMETSRVIADSQNESGIRFGVWPRGNILQLDSQHFGGAKARAYTYMTGSEIDATPFITDFKKREYNSTTIASTQNVLVEIFPGSRNLISVARGVSETALRRNGAEASELSNAFASVVYTHFLGRDETPYGNLSVVSVKDLPILVIDDKRDFERFIPYEDVVYSERTNIASFIITPNSLGRGGIFTNTLFVMCMTGAREEDISQHIRAHLAFKKAKIKLRNANPILVSEVPITKDEIIDDIVKRYALSFIVRHDKNINWRRRSTIIKNITEPSDSGPVIAPGSVALSIRKLIWMEDSPYYLGGLLSDLDIALDRRESFSDVEEKVVDRLTKALHLFSDISMQRPSREFQLIAGYYLSLFDLPDWEGAIERFNVWKKSDDFVHSLKIPRMFQNINL